MKFCDKLTNLRKKNNMSQEQLADKLNVSRQAVSKWESGQSMPDMEKIFQLCKILNCSLDELIDDRATGNSKTQDNKNNINTYLKEILDFITKTLNMFWSMRTIEKIKCILEMGFLILMIFFIWFIIGEIIYSMFSNLLYMLPSTIFRLIYSISKIIYQIFGLIVGTIIFVHVFKIRYLDYFITIEDNNTTEKNIEIPVEEKLQDKTERKFIEHKKNKIIIRDPKHSTYNFFTLLAHLILWLIKFILVLIAIPAVICFVFISFALTTSLYLIKDGIFFLGITSIFIGCILANYIVLKIIYNFILDQKHNIKKIFIIFIIGLLLMGIGTSISFTTYLSFEDNTKIKENIEYTTKEEFIEVNDYIILDFLYHNQTQIIEDNTRENIKIEITYNKEGDANISNYRITNTEYDKYGEYIYETYTVYETYYSYDSNPINELNHLLDKLKNKERIDNYYYQGHNNISNIKIYISKSNLEKMKTNYKKYN